MIRAVLVLVVALPLGAQTPRLPLPVEGPTAAQTFEAAGPTAAVLTGFLVPSLGPLTSWAPVFRPLGADGTLGPEQPGAWNGPLPQRWIKVVRAGAVPAGLRVLVRTGPVPMQTRQFQVFWRSWTDGRPRGPLSESPVFGQAAAETDTVRIIELRVPDNAVAVGLYGQLLAGAVVQTSLLVRVADAERPPQAEPPESTAPGPGAPAAPSAPSVPMPPLPNAR